MKTLITVWCMSATLSIFAHLSAEEQYVYFNNSQFLALGSQEYFLDLPQTQRPGQSFLFRNLIFAYHKPQETEQPEKNEEVSLDDVISVQEAVRKGGRTKFLDALVTQQLEVPHTFEFEKATLSKNRWNEKYYWKVRWELWPKIGGFSGIPFRYHARLKADGTVIPPTLYIVEQYLCPDRTGWVACRLELRKPQEKEMPQFKETEIRKRALQAWEKFVQSHKKHAEAGQFPSKIVDQKRLRIPVGQSEAGKLLYEDVWAIKMFNPNGKKEEETSLPLILYVRTTGEVGKIFYLDGLIEKTVR